MMREATARGPEIDLGEFERRLRGSAPAPAPAAKSDPLGELARLMQVGGEAPAPDPYGQMFDAAPSPSKPARVAPPPLDWPPPPPVDNLHDAFDAPLRGALHEPAPASRNLDHDWSSAPTAGAGDPFAEFERASGAAALHGAYPQVEPSPSADRRGPADYSQYAYEEEADFDPAAAPRKAGLLQRLKVRPWQAVAGVAALGAVSIGWGFAHRGGLSGSREIATISAPSGPVKVAPTAEPETARSDGGAAILDRKESAPVKTVVSHEEKPVEPRAVPRAVQLGGALLQGTAPLPQPEARKVKTVSVRPDGTLIRDDHAPAAAVAAPQEPHSTKGATPGAAAKPATTPKAAKPKDKPKPEATKPDADKDAKKTAALAAKVAGGSWSVQFGAAGSEAEAKGLVTKVASKYGSALGGHKPSFKMAKVSDKTVYRVRVGGVSKESAAAICEKVKAGGGSCFIAGN